jgi:hypothetical protein
MNYRSTNFVLPIHTDYVMGVWIFMSIRFSQRLLLSDERTDAFLRTLVYLGGYGTVEQAQKLGLANSPTRIVAHLESLNTVGFLRQIAQYPAIYQVTKSATRLVGSDLMARRWHTSLTVRYKLLGINFYLEANCWPAEFRLPHPEKIARFNDAGCPTEALPQFRGRPCLWQKFVLLRPDGKVCAVAVDRGHDTVMYQTRTLAQRYARILEHLPSEFGLIVAVATERRYQFYRKWASRPIARPFTQDTLQ